MNDENEIDELQNSTNGKTNGSWNKKIMFILLVFLLLLLLIYVIFLLQVKFNIFGNKNCECNPESDKSELSTDISNVTIEEVEINYFDESDDTTYTRIKISMINETNAEINMDKYLFQIYNEKMERIAICHNVSTFENGSKENMFPATILPKQTAKGYIYCATDASNVASLKILYSVGAHFDDEGTWIPDIENISVFFGNDVIVKK